MDAAREALRQVFGYADFRPGQEEAVRAALGGRDLLAVMPTGAGKSLCYQIPALLLPGVTVVVSPLISLMRDQVSALGQCGVRAAYINSSLTEGQTERAFANACRGMYRIVYVAPERLMTPRFLSFSRRVRIAQVVVDEAHCVSQWGQDFRPGYLQIEPYLHELPVRPSVSAFTATATAAVRADIERLLALRDPVRVTTGFDRPNLYFEVRSPRDKQAALLRFLREREGQSGIVYCATRDGVEETAALLCQNGIDAAAYHAGLSDVARMSAQERFVADDVRVIVATNAFGMGIDKSNVSFVVHMNMPKDLESYYQEAGRAGRDGEDAVCLLLFAKSDVRLCEYMIAHARAPGELDEETRRLVRARAKERLAQMTRYAQGESCLRAHILRYFGERAPDACGNCSVCLGVPRDEEAARPARRTRSTRRTLGTLDADQALMERLSLLRRRIAAAQRVPPFIVFTNATLRDMAKKRPATRAQMLRVEGVGVRKLERYGDAFLREIARYKEEE